MPRLDAGPATRHPPGAGRRAVIVSAHARELHLVARLLGGVFAFPRIQTASGAVFSLSRAGALHRRPSMTRSRSPCSPPGRDAASFALIARDGADTVELLTGDVVDVDLLADIPLDDRRHPARGLRAGPVPPGARARLRGAGRRRAAALPRRRRARLTCRSEAARAQLPSRAGAAAATPASTSPTRTTPQIVERVIADEIGRGEGANFVIRRDFTATASTSTTAPPRLTWFRALLDARARRVLDLRRRHARAHRRRREPRGARRRARTASSR